jgi:hypothetical protein
VDINKDWETIRENRKFQPKRVEVIMNWRNIDYGSTKDGQNYYMKGNKPNCSGYRIQAK